MPHRHAVDEQCLPGVCKYNRGERDADKELPVVVPATRLIANTMNALFTVFPKLSKKLSKQQAARLLSVMAISGMIPHDCNESWGYLKDFTGRSKYVDCMIHYNSNVRSIARHLGIRPNLADDFVRCCFGTNKSRMNVYPYDPKHESAWRYHKRLVAKFGESIAQEVTEYIIGVTPSERIADHFSVLSRISKNMSHASNAKFFILEGCSYVADHQDRQKPKAPGQAERIFIDEFINYLRELDDARYQRFQDEIADLLGDITDPFLPDCSAIIKHLNMSRFDEDIAITRASFKKLLGKPKPEVVVEPESKEYLDQMENAAMLEGNVSMAAAFANCDPSQLPQFLLPQTFPTPATTSAFTLPIIAPPRAQSPQARSPRVQLPVSDDEQQDSDQDN